MANSATKELMRLPSMPTIGNLLRLYRVKALKQLSQNFLMEPRLMDKFVKVAGPIEHGLVCEVGPGPGGISRSIIKKSPKYVLLIEKDTRFKPMLDGLANAAQGHCAIDVKYGDILDFDMSPLFDDSFKKNWDSEPPNIHILGNLPFDVSTILIIKWLRDISLRQNAWSYGRVKMTLTFQKEVAERMVAPILSKTRCRLSVMCQNWCRVNHKFTIPGKAFLPKPKVDVGVVHLVPLINPVIPLPFELVEKVVRTIFGCRQKYIEKGVKNLFPVALRDQLSNEVLKKAELDPTLRSFQLSVEEYGRIIYAYKEICDRDPSLYKYNYRGRKGEREAPWEEDCDESGDGDIEGSPSRELGAIR